ncbi:MAG: protein kinase [Lentisphaerales bacterium]|nr:protein kinase [Lentisphaerales bacterium]
MSEECSHTTIQLPKEQESQFNDLKANREAGKRYIGFSVVNRGGMGTIFKTTDANTGREIAMKMAVNADNEEQSLVRLLHEAKVTANLEHPNIIPVHEISCDTNDDIYYTMKYVQGDSLGCVLDKLAADDKEYLAKFPLTRLLNIFLRICDGVAFSHSKGVIHRDLKPDNIMIGDFGEVLIMDWGIAKVQDKESLTRTHNEMFDVDVAPLAETYSGKDAHLTTHSGNVFGTPAFMAPEQIRGENDDVNARTDIYALGGILYYILALKLPCGEQDVPTLFNVVLNGNIVAPAKLPCSIDHKLPHIPSHQISESLSAVTMKAMALEPENRYQDVKKLQEDICSYMSGFATVAEDASHLRQFGLMLNRNSLFVMVILLIITMSVVSYVKDLDTEKQLKIIQYQYDENLQQLSKGKSMPFHEMELEALTTQVPELLIITANLISENKIDNASRLLAVIFAVDKTSPEAYCLQGIVYERRKRFESAVEAYRAALRRNPNSSAASEGIKRCTVLAANAKDSL